MIPYPRKISEPKRPQFRALFAVLFLAFSQPTPTSGKVLELILNPATDRNIVETASGWVVGEELSDFLRAKNDPRPVTSGDSRIFMEFNLAEMPAGSAIQSAALSLHGAGFIKITTEQTSIPLAVHWYRGDGIVSVADNDRESALLGTVVWTKAEDSTRKEIAATSAISTAVAGSHSHVGFRAVSAVSDGGIALFSKEVIDPGLRPRLQIKFRLPPVRIEAASISESNRTISISFRADGRDSYMLAESLNAELPLHNWKIVQRGITGTGLLSLILPLEPQTKGKYFSVASEP